MIPPPKKPRREYQEGDGYIPVPAVRRQAQVRPQTDERGELIFPEYLQDRPARRPQTRPQAQAQRPIPQHLEKRREEVQRYYDEQPEEAEVRPPPKRRTKIKTVMAVVFIIVTMLGAAASVMNFLYARGAANMATSVSFLHLELTAVFVAMVFMFISLDIWGR